jgi:hypothetical protein
MIFLLFLLSVLAFKEFAFIIYSISIKTTISIHAI